MDNRRIYAPYFNYNYDRCFSPAHNNPHPIFLEPPPYHCYLFSKSTSPQSRGVYPGSHSYHAPDDEKHWYRLRNSFFPPDPWNTHRANNISDTYLPIDPNNILPPISISPRPPYMQSHLQRLRYYPHPLINAQDARSTLIFDLSSPRFLPMRYVGDNQTISLTPQDLKEPATYPPAYSVRMLCDLISNWPIDARCGLTGNYGFLSSAVTVGDILHALWAFMRTRISHVQWAAIAPEHQLMVSTAYIKRCRASPLTEMTTLNEGVKKVDFLLGRIWFKGLVQAESDSCSMKIVVV